MTIDGPGANQLSVSGNNASRVFEIAAGLNVTISGLTVTHGYAPDQGGGILNDGSNLTLSGDVLSQNVAIESATGSRRRRGPRQPGRHPDHHRLQDHRQPGAGRAGASAFGDAFGGGIDVAAGSATISNSTISGNLARGGDGSSDGGAEGGGIFSNVPLVITSSIISGNVAMAGDGSSEVRAAMPLAPASRTSTLSRLQAAASAAI